MAYTLRSISQVGTSEPFELQVSRGQIPGHSPLNKFGTNPSVSADEETIWHQGGIYSYLTVPTTLYVSSSSAADTAGGTGSNSVEVQGIDADYNVKTETVNLNGQTQVALPGTWLRVFRSFVTLAGSGGTSAGEVYVGSLGATAGVPNVIYANLNVSNQTQLALYTVPAGHTLYVNTVTWTAALSSSNAYITTNFNVRLFGSNVFRTRMDDTLQSGELFYDLQYPLEIPEKSDIECRAQTSSNSATAEVSATFEGILIQNEGPL